MFWFWLDVRTVRRTLLLFVVFLFPLFVPLSEGGCWNRAVGSSRFLWVLGSDDFFKQIWSQCELCNISSQKRNWIVKFVANANVCKENCRSGILKTFSFGLFVFNFVHLRCVTVNEETALTGYCTCEASLLHRVGGLLILTRADLQKGQGVDFFF